MTDGDVFDLEVVGHGELFLHANSEDGGATIDEYSFSGTQEGVGPASLKSLEQALLRWRQRLGEKGQDTPISVILSDVAEEDYAPGDPIITSPSLLLLGKRLFLHVKTFSDEPPSDPAAVRRLFAPFLSRRDASLHDAVVERKRDIWSRPNSEYWSLSVIADWPIDDHTVADIWSFGEEAHALLQASEGGTLTQANALDLLQGKRWDLFIHQPESEWLDAKAAPYGGPGEAWKRELAKDVAAFANRPEGGLIVIGMATERKGDLDLIQEIRPLDLDLVSAETYRKVVGQWAYPEVSGLTIEHIPGDEEKRGLVVLIVPPQPRSSFPFIVTGFLLDGSLEGRYMLIPFRRADETVFESAAAIHARLRLGQQALDAEAR